MDSLIPIIQISLGLLLLLVGFSAGTINEKRHYRSIEKRERWSSRLPAVSYRTLHGEERVKKAEMVMGSSVVSIDYFKRMLAGLRNTFGGRVSAYETLVDRARREALLRMKEQARGASIVLNVRVETSNVASRDDDGGTGSVEALAYGTAVWYER